MTFKLHEHQERAVEFLHERPSAGLFFRSVPARRCPCWRR